jgi:hypothetical protein
MARPVSFTMGYLCPEMSAVANPGIKPILDPFKKIILLLSCPFDVVVSPYFYKEQKSCKTDEFRKPLNISYS